MTGRGFDMKQVVQKFLHKASMLSEQTAQRSFWL
jgi:hypothetical protein